MQTYIIRCSESQRTKETVTDRSTKFNLVHKAACYLNSIETLRWANLFDDWSLVERDDNLSITVSNWMKWFESQSMSISFPLRWTSTAVCASFWENFSRDRWPKEVNDTKAQNQFLIPWKAEDTDFVRSKKSIVQWLKALVMVQKTLVYIQARKTRWAWQHHHISISSDVQCNQDLRGNGLFFRANSQLHLNSMVHPLEGDGAWNVCILRVPGFTISNNLVRKAVMFLYPALLVDSNKRISFESTNSTGNFWKWRLWPVA